MVKIGKLRVFSCFGGRFRPTIGPYVWCTLIPQIAMCAMMVGVLIAMTTTISSDNNFRYFLMGMISIEAIAYWTLCFSEPGIPANILKKAVELENRQASNIVSINNDNE